MRNQVAIVGLCALSAAMLGACSEELGGFGSGLGRIKPAVDIDTETVSSPTAPKSRAEVSGITKEDLSLKISKKDGSFAKTWDKLSDYDVAQTYSVGEYTVEAFYGDPATEGFEQPAFAGACAITVADGQTTEVALTATPANAMFKVDYSEAFDKYMTAYGATFVTARGSYDYAAGEERPLFVAPGQVTLNVAATTPTGTSANFKVATVTAEAGYCYTVHVDVNGGEVGEASLIVSFDENLATEEVVIDLSDKVLTTPAPTVEAEGFTAAEPVVFISGFDIDAAPAMNIVALAGLKSVTMHTESASLIAKGWPADVELVNNKDARLTSLGLAALGLWQNPDKMAVLDFAGVLKNISVNADSPANTFTVTVTDALNRVSDPLTLTVTPEAPNLVLSQYDNFEPGANLRVALDFNGTAQELQKNVTFTYAHSSGTARQLDIVAVEAASRAMNSYIVTITTPNIDGVLKLSASCGGVTSSCDIKTVDFQVAVNNLDVYATRAYATVNAVNGANPDLSGVKFLLKGAADSDYREVAATLGDGYYRLDGLTASTAYQLRAKVGDDQCKPVAFTTEAAAQIPNGSLDADVTYNGTGSYWENVVFSGWGTNNALTTSQGSAYAYCRISGTIQTDDAHSGKAALIRNVGWGSGNTATGSKGTSGTCKYNEVGLLHLGSTRSARPAGYGSNDNMSNGSSTGPITTEDLDCGIAIESRPSVLSFWYKYSPKNSADHGLAEVFIYATDGSLIAQGTLNLAATTTYTQQTINFSYPAGTPKAAKIYVKFLSSNSMDYVKRSDANYSGPGFGNLSRGTFMGAQLYIDDIELTY